MEKTRERLLGEIRARGSASTAELVTAIGLHENTVREHLARLHSDGRIRREQDPPSGRGRPRWRWHAVDTAALDAGIGLAIALSDTLARSGLDASSTARDAGVAWGARIAAESGTAYRDDPRGFVVEVMERQGFAPEPADTDADTDTDTDTDIDTDTDAIAATDVTLRLRRCPLLSAVRHTDVVCAVHEGLIEGLVRGRAAGVRAVLEPFAADGACLLHLRALS